MRSLVVALLVSALIPLPGAEPLQVRTSTTILADWVATVGGAQVVVHSLIPDDGDPHAWQPAPKAVADLLHADLVVLVGQGLESRIEALLADRVGPHLSLADLVLEGEEHALEPDHDHAHGHEDEPTADDQLGAHHHDHGLDPHIWLDVALAQAAVGHIRDALIDLDPDHADGYRQRAAAYLTALGELDQWIRDQVSGLPEADRELVTGHDAFGHFARAYGFRTLGSLMGSQSTVAAEPSPKALARLAEAVREAEVKALFPESNHSRRLVESLAAETGAAIAPPLPTGGLGGQATYIESMRVITTTIVEALGGADGGR